MLFHIEGFLFRIFILLYINIRNETTTNGSKYKTCFTYIQLPVYNNKTKYIYCIIYIYPKTKSSYFKTFNHSNQSVLSVWVYRSQKKNIRKTLRNLRFNKTNNWINEQKYIKINECAKKKYDWVVFFNHAYSILWIKLSD